MLPTPLVLPCIFPTPDPVATVKKRDVLDAADRIESNGSFLGNKQAMKYTAKLFRGRSASQCRLEYMSAGMVLLAVGSMKEKLESLFDAFQFSVGGVFNKDALERTLRSLLKTALDMGRKIAESIGGFVKLPGGKAVALMF